MDTVKKEKKVDLPKKKSDKKKKFIIIVGIIVAFIIGLTVFVNIATSAPVKVANELISDIQAEDADAAYDLMSTDAQDVTDSKDFAAAIDRIGPILSGKPKFVSKEISAATGSSNTATVIYDIAGSDDVDYRFTIELSENDGKWEVDSFLSEKQ